MSDKPAGPTQRLLKLAGMTARISGDVARDRWQRLWQQPEDRSAQDAALYARIGKEIAATLGDMKGAVMKVGQIVSQYRDLLPPELLEALSALQKDSPPRPFSDLLPRLHEAFGPDLGLHFSAIDEQALASASIAQVHRARTRDGRDVVIKIQYPGVDAAVAADLRQLQLAFRIARVLPVPSETLDALFDEIRLSLQDELDYRHEAATLAEFRAFHASDPRVIIPEVLPALSGRHVLTLAHEPGDPLGSLDARYDAALRDRLGELLFRTMGAQLYQLRHIHCDPHPGNFAARPDGSLVIYDFGCSKRISAATAQAYAQLTRAAMAGNAGDLENWLIRLGARNTGHTAILPADFYQPWLKLAGDTIADSATDFASLPLAERVLKLSRKALPQWRAFQPVPEIVMVNRALGGHYWNLRQLGSRLAVKPLLTQVLEASGSR